jgi:large subunit ribosomal protein L31
MLEQTRLVRLVSGFCLRYRGATPKSGSIFGGCVIAPARFRSHFRGTWTMKADTHPHYHWIKVVMTDGTEYMTRSTYGKDGDTLNLDIDPKTHPAWTGGSQQLMDRGGRLSKFNSRFGGISLGKK